MLRHCRVRAAVLVGIVLAAAAAAGCAGPSRASSPPPRVTTPALMPLSVGVAENGVSWATVQTGGPSVGGRFWQLLAEDQATGTWRVVTPPGVADNAGLVVTRATDGTITTGFVPSDLLKFSPLAMSTDGGAHWAQALLPAGLAPEADGLAALPDGRLLAVTTAGVEESAAGAKSWTPLVTLRTLASTPAGRRCGLTSLTGTTGLPGGSVLIAGDCSRPGQLGLFGNASGSWEAIDPGLPLPVSEGKQSVLGLISSGTGTSALFEVAMRHSQLLIPAVLPAGKTSWSYYPGSFSLFQSMTVKGGSIASVSGSPEGVWAVTLRGRRGLASGYAGRVRPQESKPFSVPGPDATVVASASGGFTALVPGLSSIAVWQRSASGAWQRTQTIDVASAPAGS